MASSHPECPKCGGETILFRGVGREGEYWICEPSLAREILDWIQERISRAPAGEVA